MKKEWVVILLLFALQLGCVYSKEMYKQMKDVTELEGEDEGGEICNMKCSAFVCSYHRNFWDKLFGGSKPKKFFESFSEGLPTFGRINLLGGKCNVIQVGGYKIADFMGGKGSLFVRRFSVGFGDTPIAFYFAMEGCRGAITTALIKVKNENDIPESYVKELLQHNILPIIYIQNFPSYVQEVKNLAKKVAEKGISPLFIAPTKNASFGVQANMIREMNKEMRVERHFFASCEGGDGWCTCENEKISFEKSCGVIEKKDLQEVLAERELVDGSSITVNNVKVDSATSLGVTVWYLTVNYTVKLPEAFPLLTVSFTNLSEAKYRNALNNTLQRLRGEKFSILYVVDPSNDYTSDDVFKKIEEDLYFILQCIDNSSNDFTPPPIFVVVESLPSIWTEEEKANFISNLYLSIPTMKGYNVISLIFSNWTSYLDSATFDPLFFSCTLYYYGVPNAEGDLVLGSPYLLNPLLMTGVFNRNENGKQVYYMTQCPYYYATIFDPSITKDEIINDLRTKSEFLEAEIHKVEKELQLDWSNRELREYLTTLKELKEKVDALTEVYNTSIPVPSNLKDFWVFDEKLGKEMVATLNVKDISVNSTSVSVNEKDVKALLNEDIDPVIAMLVKKYPYKKYDIDDLKKALKVVDKNNLTDVLIWALEKPLTRKEKEVRKFEEKCNATGCRDVYRYWLALMLMDRKIVYNDWSTFSQDNEIIKLTDVYYNDSDDFCGAKNSEYTPSYSQKKYCGLTSSTKKKICSLTEPRKGLFLKPLSIFSIFSARGTVKELTKNISNLFEFVKENCEESCEENKSPEECKKECLNESLLQLSFEGEEKEICKEEKLQVITSPQSNKATITINVRGDKRFFITNESIKKAIDECKEEEDFEDCLFSKLKEYGEYVYLTEKKTVTVKDQHYGFVGDDKCFRKWKDLKENPLDFIKFVSACVCPEQYCLASWVFNRYENATEALQEKIQTMHITQLVD